MGDERETYRTRVAAARAAPPKTKQPGALGLRGIASILRRRLRLFAVTFTLILGVGVAYAALRPPLYRASAEVLSASGGAQADAEMRLIRSPGMARDVAAALGLDRDAAFASAGAGPVARVRRSLGLDRGAASARPDDRRTRAAERLAAGVAVTRPADTVSLLIGYTAASPGLAARVANEYARQYARRQIESATPADRAGARILSEAEPPLAPITLHPGWIALAAALIGLVAGLIAAVVRERRFRGITSGGEVEARTGLHHLGTVPLVGSVLKDARSPADAVVDSPRSGFAEAFRSLRTAIRIAGGEQAQTIAIASVGAGEGRTTLAACLARTMAMGGERVVLVDCDHSGTGASRLLVGEAATGLADVVAGRATFAEALVLDEASGAYVLPPGTGAARSKPGDPGLDRVVADLRDRFQHVIVDAPAVGADATATVAFPADLFVLAVRWRSTADHAVRRTAAALSDAGAKVGGVALTQVDMRRQVKYVHDDESNYYAKLSKYYS